MKRKTTQKMIAEELGVSPAAVSFCLNGKEGVSAELRSRVLSLAEKRHCAGKNLPVAVVFSGNDDPIGPYTMKLMNEFNNECRRRNLPLFFLSCRDNRLLRCENFRGVISLDYSGSTGIELPEKEPLPLVSINEQSHPLSGVYSVCSNERKMFRMLFERLRQAGHIRIGYCYSGNIGRAFFPNFRQQAMREAAAEFPELVVSEQQITAAHPVLENVLMLRQEEITALIVAGEANEFSARQALQLLKIRLPEEMALVTWENAGQSEYYNPPQTTVEQDFPRLVRTALDHLEILISGGEIENAEIDYLLHDRGTW